MLVAAILATGLIAGCDRDRTTNPSKAAGPEGNTTARSVAPEATLPTETKKLRFPASFDHGRDHIRAYRRQ